ncbi:hypothetical protein Bca52824_083811 [Brassica carinata]|uniref:Uncharacterized protein n=1 Tax=Brassica carinata TaxID=52824 RepID=A0A8X7PM42_BRACI|nr:hypothetical protein Bca52824_083811 [Brassica carinata]
MSKYLSSDKNGTNEQNLSFYTSACEEDPELKSFDSSLDQRLSKLKRSLTTGGKTGNNSLNAVKSVKAMGDPFGDEFKEKLESVRAEHLMLLEKLGELEKKLEKQQDKLKKKRKLTTIAFASVAASILAIEVCACCVVPQAALNGVVQGAAGLTQLMATGGLYANAKMKNREKDLDRQKEVVDIMFDNTNVNIQGTNTINSLVDKLIDSLSLILVNVERAVVKREEEAVKPVMDLIRDEVEAFATAIKEVGEAVATCNSCVASGKLQVLEHITNSMSSKGKKK